MGKITNIAQQKKDPKRFNVYVGEQFAFGISANLRFEKRLEISQRLSEKQIQNLIEADQIERLLNKGLNILSFRPRSEKEIRDYLLRKGKLKEVRSEAEKDQYKSSLEKVISRLKKLKQINDYAFAKWWVDQRTRFKPRGPYVIRGELLAKGVSREVVDELTNIKKEDQIHLALTAASKKISAYKKLEEVNFRKKLESYLVGRGFSWEIAKNAVDTITDKR
ncbi:RecX family transcriptional regulator [Patescibacteria group bacterium]|nr:RecX family transcriptional regulator [Patescibacteria group bacterium]